MSTTLVARPAAAPPRDRFSPLRHALNLRHSSPGRLQLFLAALLTLGLLTGLVAGLAAHAARSGTTDLAERSQPLMNQAETIYTKLADADQKAAQGFLSGGLEPAELTDAYNVDLQQATAALTEASRLTGGSPAAAKAVLALSNGLPRYAELVATARANNRQGRPLGASYLAAASAYSQGTLLPAARSLFVEAQIDVNRGYDRAAGRGWLALFATLLILLTVTLIGCQVYLSRHTRRTFNLRLLAASAATVLLALATGGVLSVQGAHLSQAQSAGSRPVALLVNARILALQARSAEELTLAAHGSVSAAQRGVFPTATSRLLAADGPLAHPYVGGDDRSGLAAKLDDAKNAVRAYVAMHQEVDRLDQGGHYDEAVALAISDRADQAFDAIQQDVTTALDNRRAVFSDQIHDAGHGLGLLTAGGPLLALLVCAFAYAGLRPRLQEYR